MSAQHSHALTFDSDPYSVTNFVERMHGECARLQWLRELVVNSVEAIAATGEGGSILVHPVDQDMGDGTTVRKLAVTDTGEGIAEHELYSSFQVAMTSRGRGNFGIGAKIAALPMNPAGLIYRSLVDGGDPAELIWHKTYRTGTGHYAASGIDDDETGETRYVTEPSCDPDTYDQIIDAGHGTQVVLCGEEPGDDTCKTLSPSPSKSTGNLHWAIRELNFKFWRIPKNTEIRVQNTSTKGPASYIVHGGEVGMKEFATAQGVVELEANPYRVRWFLLDDKTRNSQNGWSEGRILGTLYLESTGVIEVYALRRQKTAAGLMNDFGIYTGADRVVLLVEPKHQELLQPTTARNDLRIEDEGNVSSLYKEIGQEFASLMAEKAPILAGYVKEQLDGLKSDTDEQILREVIARVAALYDIRDFRRLAKGRSRVSDDETKNVPATPPAVNIDSPDDDDEPPTPTPPTPPRPRPTPRPRPRPRPKPVVDPKGNRRAQDVPPDIPPKIFKWTRLPDTDDVTDYETKSQRVVNVNTEAETYNRLLALYNSRPDFAEHPEVVEKVVRVRCEACLQLAIFSLEREFDTRGKRLGTDFDGFFKRNTGRVCLDGMASKDVDVATVREIRNLIAKAKSVAAAEAQAAG